MEDSVTMPAHALLIIGLVLVGVLLYRSLVGKPPMISASVTGLAVAVGCLGGGTMVLASKLPAPWS